MINTLTPKYMKKVSDVVYQIENLAIKANIPENMKIYLIQEMESVIEACERFMPEKCLTYTIMCIPAKIRVFIQQIAEEIGLNLSISDEARKECKSFLTRKKLDKILSKKNRNETFLKIMLLHFNLRDLRSDANHISKKIRDNLSERYQIPDKEYKNIYALLTTNEFAAVYQNIRAELTCLETMTRVKNIVSEAKIKFSDDAEVQEIMKRIITLLSLLFKFKNYKKHVLQTLYYLKVATFRQEDNATYILKHALNSLLKIVKTNRRLETVEKFYKQLFLLLEANDIQPTKSEVSTNKSTTISCTVQDEDSDSIDESLEEIYTSQLTGSTTEKSILTLFNSSDDSIFDSDILKECKIIPSFSRLTVDE